MKPPGVRHVRIYPSLRSGHGSVPADGPIRGLPQRTEADDVRPATTPSTRFLFVPPALLAPGLNFAQCNGLPIGGP